MKKRFMTVFLACALVISMLAVSASAAGYVDVDGHWGEEAIEYWSAYGIVDGMGDNRFEPDGYLTRAQAATILANLLKLVDEADISAYTDCVPGEWYYVPIAKCVAAGILNGVGDNTMDPHSTVSRAQMFTMFARALGIKEATYCTKSYLDSSDIPPYAVGYMNALVNLGYIDGTGGGKMSPLAQMTRASIMQLLSNTISAYVTEGGVVEPTGEGVVLVVTDEPTQVTGDFSGTVVATQANTVVSLSGLTGSVSVVAAASGISVVNAPAGTAVSAAPGAADVEVNGTPVEETETEVVPGTPVVPVQPTVPVIPTPPTVVHSTYVVDNENGTHTIYCICGTCAPITQTCSCTAVSNGDGATHTLSCSVCGYTVTGACDGAAATCISDATACSVCGYTTGGKATGHTESCGHTAEESMKFQAKIESGATAGANAVTLTVLDDYTAQFVLPESTVNAASVTVTATMKDVASLGTAGTTKSESLTINTGITGKENVALTGWLNNVYTFTGASANVQIGSAGFTYALAGTYTSGTGTVIEATPSDIEAARAAWQELTSHVTVTEGAADSKIFVAQGSSLTMGGHTVCFENTEVTGLTLDNFNDMSALKATVKDTLKLEEAVSTGVVAVLKSGTALSVGSTTATLNSDTTISITGIDPDSVEGVLDDLRDAVNQDSTYNMLNQLVSLVNNLVGSMNNQKVTITVSFAS